MERLKILIFRIGNRHFGLASKNVKEILDSCGNLKSVFYGGRALRGLMSFEGDIISVLDAPYILDIDESSEDSMVLICKEKEMERAVGMTISEVKGMRVIGTSGIDPSQEDDAAYISGFIREGEGEKEMVVTLLDLKGFLDYADTKIERL